MTALSNSIVLSRNSAISFSSGSSLKSEDRCVLGIKGIRRSYRTLTVKASRSDGGRPSDSSIFVGGFVLGGLVMGTLGCVYAPQISAALIGTDKKDLMKKLPKFIYDEDKALEKQRKRLAEKIEQLNSAIDNVSNQLRSEESPNGTEVSLDDIEAPI